LERLDVTLGLVEATSPVSVSEYAVAELGRPVNVVESHARMDDCGVDAGAPSEPLLRGVREVAALSDPEEEAGAEREERAISPLRGRGGALDSLMNQHPRFVAGSIWYCQLFPGAGLKSGPGKHSIA
jgi:hypothetical protein